MERARTRRHVRPGVTTSGVASAHRSVVPKERGTPRCSSEGDRVWPFALGFAAGSGRDREAGRRLVADGDLLDVAVADREDRVLVVDHESEFAERLDALGHDAIPGLDVEIGPRALPRILNPGKPEPKRRHYGEEGRQHGVLE